MFDIFKAKQTNAEVFVPESDLASVQEIKDYLLENPLEDNALSHFVLTGCTKIIGKRVTVSRLQSSLLSCGYALFPVFNSWKFRIQRVFVV